MKKTASYEEGLMIRLKDPKYAAGYLKACIEDEEGDWEELFLMALRDVAKAHGFKNIAESAQLGRESLYKSLSAKGDPKLSTLVSVLDGLGLKISIEPIDKKISKAA